jgi:hypothetical protein
VAEHEKKSIWGTLGDLLKASSSSGAKRPTSGTRRVIGSGGGNRQPKKPCGGCGSK